MLDPAHPKPIDLSGFEGYKQTCLNIAAERLAGYGGLDQVAEHEDDLNQYPRLGLLSDPRGVVVLDEAHVGDEGMQRAARALLEGKVLLEHTCAGEATRLGLGTKYTINPRSDLTTEVLRDRLGLESWDVDPSELTGMSLGRRHMLQMAWDIAMLADDLGVDPHQALANQTLLVIVNESSGEQILEDFREARFYGFRPEKVLFMVQRSFAGMALSDGGWSFESDSPRRLHNHGQMLMQTTMDGQVFRLEPGGGRQHLSWEEYHELAKDFDDKISFNIEDLDYLDQSLDLVGLTGALKLGDGGARMIMEVVANNPDNPQKGGSLAWDPELGRDVMIESFQLKGVANADIKYLNKNINHYPQPAEMLAEVRQHGLSMPLAVKKGFLYFQPVQGDVNFLVPTAFVRRPQMGAIAAWKSGANTPAALAAMARQERRAGFMEWARNLTGLALA